MANEEEGELGDICDVCSFAANVYCGNFIVLRKPASVCRIDMVGGMREK